MKKELYRTADAKGRVALPGFANATVVIEKVDDTEYRVRKALVIPENDLPLRPEELHLHLSERDARTVLESLDNPPAPNKTARRAAKEFRKACGLLED